MSTKRGNKDWLKIEKMPTKIIKLCGFVPSVCYPFRSTSGTFMARNNDAVHRVPRPCADAAPGGQWSHQHIPSILSCWIGGTGGLRW